MSSSDEEDGWVHGGKFVPLNHRSVSLMTTSTTKTATLQTSTPTAPSPYSMLSPPTLNTPASHESMNDVTSA